MSAGIVGWGHSKFVKAKGEDVESMIVRVAGQALADAGVAASEVDAIFVGHFNCGFVAQDFSASLVLQACASSRRPGSRTPAPPARQRSTRGSTPSPPAGRASSWWWGSRR